MKYPGPCKNSSGIKMIYLYSEFIPKFGTRSLWMESIANTIWKTMIITHRFNFLKLRSFWLIKTFATKILFIMQIQNKDNFFRNPNLNPSQIPRFNKNSDFLINKMATINYQQPNMFCLNDSLVWIEKVDPECTFVLLQKDLCSIQKFYFARIL